MQRVAVLKQLRVAAVLCIPEQRCSDGCEMGTNLMAGRPLDARFDQGERSADIEHANGFVSAATVAPDEQTFAFASSNTEQANNYWVSVLAKP